MRHEYFGEILAPNNDLAVIWEKDFCLESDVFTITLWASNEQNLCSYNLDSFARYCQNLDKHDQTCRREMLNELRQDASYMTESLGEIQEQVQSPKLQKLIDENATVEQFVQAMNLTGISLWAHIYDYMGKPFISVDYMIDKAYSDEILCVCHDLEGNLIHVSHES